MIRTNRWRLALGGWLLGTAVAAAPPGWGPEPPLLSLECGLAQIFDSRQEFYWAVEYRPAARLFHFGPWFFFGTGRETAFYAAAGVLMDIRLGPAWVVTPAFGGGYYNAENGLDLGFDAEFRTSLEIARRFRNQHRLGLRVAHLSNGSLSDRNPGTETLALIYSWPLDSLIHRIRGTSSAEP